MSGRAAQAHGACRRCLRRSWLLGELGATLDFLAPDRGRLHDALALSDRELIDSLAGRRREELHARHAGFDERLQPLSPGVEALCRHDPRYPDGLRVLPGPATLHAEGGAARLRELARAPVVTLLGSKRPSDYGIEVATTLARELSASGVTLASLLTDGVGAAAQLGAQVGAGASIAVLGGGLALASRPRLRPLRERLRGRGCVVSELPCAVPGRRWGEPAAERIAVALASLVIVIEARDTPRELAGARLASGLGRPLAALPGRVTSALARGPHVLLREGAGLVRDAQDVLDLLDGIAPRSSRGGRQPGRTVPLPAPLAAVLELVGSGADTPDRLLASGAQPDGLLLALSQLELLGLLGRGENGRYLSRRLARHSHI